MKWQKNWYGTTEPCVFCTGFVEVGEGVILSHEGHHHLYHERCLCLLADIATQTSIETREVRGVFYTTGDSPLPPPLQQVPRRPPQMQAAPEEPKTYRAKLPPRPKTNT